MFKLLAILLAAYVGRCLMTGSVYGRSGAWGRSWRRDDDPVGFWGAIAAYALLADCDVLRLLTRQQALQSTGCGTL